MTWHVGTYFDPLDELVWKTAYMLYKKVNQIVQMGQPCAAVLEQQQNFPFPFFLLCLDIFLCPEGMLVEDCEKQGEER